jgi:hypothetical protein
MAVETTESVVREAPDIEAFKIGLLESARQLGSQGVTLPPQLVADLTDLQRRAGDLAAAGVGSYQPYIQQGGLTIGDAQTLLSGVPASVQQTVGQASEALQRAGAFGTDTAAQGIAGLAGTGAAYDPRSASAFFDPYQDAVVNQALQDIARSGQIQQQQLNAGAVGAGAFGGSRQAIAQQELNRNILDQQARTAAQLRSSGYQSALGASQAAFDQQLARQQQAAQLTGALGAQGAQAGLNAAQSQGQLGLTGTGQIGQIGQSLGNLGAQQAGIGQLLQQTGQAEQAFLFDLGKQYQGQQQAELEARRNTELQQLYEPYQRLGFVSDIYKGAPSSQNTITSASSPNTSPAQQILGFGVAGLSAAAGANKLGLFG